MRKFSLLIPSCLPGDHLWMYDTDIVLFATGCTGIPACVQSAAPVRAGEKH